MNQAILKILDDIAKESIESFGESIPSGSYPKWIKIAKDRISSLPSDTQWIDVRTALPESEGEYLVGYPTGKVIIAKFSKALNKYDAFFYVDNPSPKGTENSYKPIGPKFWMPLPTPPNN